MKNTSEIAMFLLLSVTLIVGSISPVMASQTDKTGEYVGCEKANDNSKVREQNPGCQPKFSDLEIQAPDLVFGSGDTVISFEYVATITNNGPSTIEYATLTATSISGAFYSFNMYPEFGWNTLKPGESTNVPVNGTAKPGAVLEISVSPSSLSDSTDPDYSNNSVMTLVTVAASISPTAGSPGTPFTITDPLGRMQAGDTALFFLNNPNPLPSDGSVPALNVVVSPDGTTMTGTVPNILIGPASVGVIQPGGSEFRFPALSFEVIP